MVQVIRKRMIQEDKSFDVPRPPPTSRPLALRNQHVLMNFCLSEEKEQYEQHLGWCTADPLTDKDKPCDPTSLVSEYA